MKEFPYKPSFYPHFSHLRAKSQREAEAVVQKMFPEYPGLDGFTVGSKFFIHSKT